MNHQMRLWVLAIFSVGTKLDAVIMSPVSQPVEHHELINQRIYLWHPQFFRCCFQRFSIARRSSRLLVSHIRTGVVIFKRISHFVVTK